MSRFRSVYDPGDALIAGDVNLLEAKFPITAPDIAAGAVIDTKLATDAVTPIKIQADAVTTAKIANDAVTQPKAAAGVVDGDTITGSVIQTASSGERVVIRNDGSGGIIEFFSGAASETAGYLDPSINGALPNLILGSGTNSTYTRRPTVNLSPGKTAATAKNSEASLDADYTALSASNGTHVVAAGGNAGAGVDLLAVTGNVTVTASAGAVSIWSVTGAITLTASTAIDLAADTNIAANKVLTNNGYAVGAGADSWQVACSSTATANSTSNVTIAGWSQAVTSPGTSAVYLVTLDPDWTITVAGTTAIIELLVDGVAQTATMVLADSGTTRGAYSKTWRITGLAAGTRTFTARTRNTAGSTGSTVGVTHSLMTVERKA